MPHEKANQIHQVAPEQGEEHGANTLGSELPLWSVIPFIGILLSIAIFPLVAPDFWHHNFGKVSAFWGLLFAVPFVIAYKGEAVHAILHTYFLEYIPFIILLWSLYTVAGGILARGAPVGTPFANLVVLIIGTALASWIGTTGAAMVMIRPYIKMNIFRKSKVHLIVFFIFLIANIGGSLTPLGDPPLFLGFLQGVPFFWTFRLFWEMLFVVAIVLTIFFLWDSYMFRKEGWKDKIHILRYHFSNPEAHMDDIAFEELVEIENQDLHTTTVKKARLEIDGLVNIIFLLGIIGGVLFSGYVHMGEVTVLGVHMHVQNLIRDGFLILMGLLSLKITPWEYREGNDFTWFPIQEVAKLFAGIFVTIIPALAMLQAGMHGHLAMIIKTVKEPWHYFWITGSLSSFLDNAPTYLVFLNTALGQFFSGTPTREAVHLLIAQKEIYLAAISTGAVFFGAMTYIGNAPNFMVKSIAEQFNIKMPSFFGYMLYSLTILGIVFLLVTFIFF
ncbi:MAG: sodium:proton antiporter [Calditrichaeota bacterium]|nr:MAG: sodium:proton antiporter [Calditrichota bacterium]